MYFKSIAKFGLLAFVAAAMATAVFKESKGKVTSNNDIAKPADVVPTDNGLFVYYFHGETRCPTCRKIESYAHTAIESGFQEELGRGEMSWRVLNYEDPDNATIVEKLEVLAPTVVLIDRKKGIDIQHRTLDRVWSLVGKPPAFQTYIQEETREMLRQRN